MAVKRFSNSLISQSGQDKVTNFIAGYSPAVDEMDLIERVIVGSGGASSITFFNIPQTYQHLQLKIIGRSNRTSATSDYFNLQLNGDTGNNYSFHVLQGNGSAVGAGGYATQTSIELARIAAFDASANVFGAVIVDLLDYTSTTKNKIIRQFGGSDNNGNGLVSLHSGLWINTSSVNSLIIKPFAGSASWIQYSTASLYGVKA